MRGAAHGEHAADALERGQRVLGRAIGRKGQAGDAMALRKPADQLVDPHGAAAVRRKRRVGGQNQDVHKRARLSKQPGRHNRPEMRHKQHQPDQHRGDCGERHVPAPTSFAIFASGW